MENGKAAYTRKAFRMGTSDLAHLRYNLGDAKGRKVIGGEKRDRTTDKLPAVQMNLVYSRNRS